jgi:ElaB/YqjD/DUF883 family membrane-anchored ribosome-binding protein
MSDPKAVADDTKDDLKQLKLDLAKLTETVSSMAAQQASSARASVSNAARQLREQGESYYHEAEARAREKAKDLEQTIVGNPFASVAAAFGLGMLMGVMSRRR